MKNLTLLIITSLFTITVSAQQEKRPLTHKDILKWERITETVISNNGKIIVYKQAPWKGDPTLKITSPKAKESASMVCGTNAQISSDSKFVIFTLKPAADSIRQLKLKKTKKEDLPINKLAIFDLKNHKTDTITELISVKVPEKWAGWITYQTKAQKDTTKKAKAKSKDEDKAYPLFVRNLNTGEIVEFPAVSDYKLAEEKEALVFISEGKDSTFDAGIYRLDLPENKTQKILEGKGKFKQLIIDKTGEKVAFIGDTSEEKKRDATSYSLYFWNNSEEAEIIADNSNSSLPENWKISENGGLTFSDNGNRLFFGTAPKKAPKEYPLYEPRLVI